MEFHYQVGSESHTVTVERYGEQYRITVNGKNYSVAVADVSNERITATVRDELAENHEQIEAYVASQGELRYVAFDSNIYTLTRVLATQSRRITSTGENSLTAAMPGQVVSVLAQQGDEVKRGQTLIILEAMKMEIRVTAPIDGRVDKILVNKGQVVERGQRLIELISS